MTMTAPDASNVVQLTRMIQEDGKMCSMASAKDCVFPKYVCVKMEDKMRRATERELASSLMEKNSNMLTNLVRVINNNQEPGLSHALVDENRRSILVFRNNDTESDPVNFNFPTSLSSLDLLIATSRLLDYGLFLPLARLAPHALIDSISKLSSIKETTHSENPCYEVLTSTTLQPTKVVFGNVEDSYVGGLCNFAVARFITKFHCKGLLSETTKKIFDDVDDIFLEKMDVQICELLDSFSSPDLKTEWLVSHLHYLRVLLANTAQEGMHRALYFIWKNFPDFQSLAEASLQMWLPVAFMKTTISETRIFTSSQQTSSKSGIAEIAMGMDFIKGDDEYTQFISNSYIELSQMQARCDKIRKESENKKQKYASEKQLSQLEELNASTRNIVSNINYTKFVLNRAIETITLIHELLKSTGTQMEGLYKKLKKRVDLEIRTLQEKCTNQEEKIELQKTHIQNLEGRFEHLQQLETLFENCKEKMALEMQKVQEERKKQQEKIEHQKNCIQNLEARCINIKENFREMLGEMERHVPRCVVSLDPIVKLHVLDDGCLVDDKGWEMLHLHGRKAIHPWSGNSLTSHVRLGQLDGLLECIQKACETYKIERNDL